MKKTLILVALTCSAMTAQAGWANYSSTSTDNTWYMQSANETTGIDFTVKKTTDVYFAASDNFRGPDANVSLEQVTLGENQHLHIHRGTWGNDTHYFNSVVLKKLKANNSSLTIGADETVTLKQVSGDLNIISDAGKLAIEGDATATNYLDLKAGSTLDIQNGAHLTIKDTNGGGGTWIAKDASLNLHDTAQITVGDLTIQSADGNEATIKRLNANSDTKLGTNANASFRKNVAVTNGDVTYTGSGTLILGSMNGGSVNTTANIQFGEADSTINSLTLCGNSITLGENHNHALTITTSLKVTETSKVNADLIISGGKLTFADNATLTMGCSVTIGTEDMVTVVMTDEMITAIHDNGGRVDLITSADAVTLGGNISFENTNGTTLSGYYLEKVSDGNGAYTVRIAPEPATATLSLLALAGLCARRRRH